MPNQYSPVATAVPDGPAYWFEDVVQCFVFGFGHAKRVIGVDTVKFQGFRVKIGPGKRLDMTGDRLPAPDDALIIHVKQYGGNLQQGIAPGVETSGFNINHDGEKTAKPAGNDCLVRHGISVPNRCGYSDVA